MEGRVCPNCAQGSMRSFYEVASVPVHSVALVRTFQGAKDFPTGRIELAVCERCGFIGNIAFDEGKMHYSPDCEETQGFSPTFNAFHRRLASDLIARFGVCNKTVLEIGCGKGEFISLLCSMGSNRGVGFDPAFEPRRTPAEGGDSVTFYQELYSERSVHVAADFVVCKMTLEHIPDPLAFLSMVRRAIGESRPTVFFQVPDMKRVLNDGAFWDIYHEHCSYFTAESLRTLFLLCGFDVHETWRDYDDQYLMIIATPSAGADRMTLDLQPAEVERALAFVVEANQRIEAWKQILDDARRTDKKVVLWGSGSKAVSFLSAMGEAGTAAVRFVVDINPFRQKCFMPGTGQRIVGPGFLAEYEPDLVIAMNAIYAEEIERDLRELGVHTTVVPIEAGRMSTTTN